MIRHRPLLAPTLAFAFGLILGEIGTLSWPWMAAGAGAVLCRAFFQLRRSGSPEALPWLLGSCVLLGIWHQTSDSSPLAWQDIRRLTRPEPQLATVRVQLLESPRVRLVESRGNSQERCVVYARLRAWRPDFGNWQEARGDIVISTRGVPDSTFFRGQSAEIQGVLRAPSPAQAPGLFDYSQHLKRHRVYRQLLTDGPQDWQPGPDFKTRRPWSEQFLPWAHATLQRGLPDDDAAGLIRSMCLGWRTGLTQTTREELARAGTLHVFAISGLHITLVAGFVAILLQVCRIPRPVCAAVALPLTWFYVAVTGWPTSGIRAATMTTVLAGGWLFNRPSDPLNSLALAAWLLLIWQPGQLFLPGFQFSFCVVGSLVTCVEPVRNFLMIAVRLDPFLPDELRPRWQLHGIRLIRAALTALATTLIAWLASLPITLHHFHLFNPIAPLLNLAAVPLASLTLCSSLLTLLFQPILEPVADWFRMGAWFWMSLLLRISQHAIHWPLSWRSVTPPPTFFWGPWTLLWVWVLCGRYPTPKVVVRHPKIRFVKPVGLSLLGACLVATGWWHWGVGKPKVQCFLPSTGESMLWMEKPEPALLFNGGSALHIQQVVLPLLRLNGYNTPPVQWITHTENRHVGGGPELLQFNAPTRVLVPEGRHRSPVYRRYVEALNTSGIPVDIVGQGARGLGWEVLHPATTDRYTRADDNASVLLRTVFGWRILWLSALGPRAQADLLSRYPDLQVDCVLSAIPTQGDALLPPLLESLQPGLVILLCGRYPAQARLNAETRRRLSEGSWHFLNTQDDGGMRLVWTSAEMLVETAEGKRLVLSMGENSRETPSEDAFEP